MPQAKRPARVRVFSASPDEIGRLPTDLEQQRARLEQVEHARDLWTGKVQIEHALFDAVRHDGSCTFPFCRCTG